MNEPADNHMEQQTRPDGTTVFTTYRLANGDLIYGEYAFVVHAEFFDVIDQPMEVVKETWVLESRETVEFKPSWWDDDDPEGMEETLTGGV